MENDLDHSADSFRGSIKEPSEDCRYLSLDGVAAFG